MIVRKLPLLPTVFFTLWLGLPASASDHYVRRGAEIPLQRTTRIAVRAEHATAQDVARFTGVDTSAVERWPIAGWWLVSPPEGVQSDAAIDFALERVELDFVAPVYVGADGGPLFATRDLLIGFADGVDAMAAEFEATRVGRVSDRRFGDMDRVWRVTPQERDGRRVLAAANELARREGVRFCEPDMIFTGRGSHIPNDPGFANCWGIHNTGQTGSTPDIDMDGPEAWDRTIGSDTVRVVILDTGVQQDHPDIHQVAGTDTTTDAGNGGPLNSFDNHGTPVGGCVAATIDNALGTVGIAPGCVVASARTFIGVNASGSWTSQASWTVASLSWAQSIGARVTNNSNYYGFQSSTIDQKYLETWNGGIVHFASAGNNGLGSITYPASLPIVNAVVAVGRDGLLTSFSNWGPGTDFAAPGISIYSTDRTGAAGYGAGDYSFVTGTSFASPYAAGVAALVLSSWPDASAAQVEQVLRGSCVDAGALGYDTTYGNGVVNARAALDVTCGGVSNFCSTSPNSVGPGAVMSVIGAPSVSANAFSLMASGCPPNSFGIFYMGPTATQVPFGNGFRCISGPIVRLPLVQANVFGDAIHQLDIPSLNPAAGIAPGATKRFQFWYRNSAGGGAGFNLSDGLQVRFCS